MRCVLLGKSLMRVPALRIALVTVLVAPMLASAAEVLTVVQRGRAFVTRELVVGRGSVVRFSNEDDFPHQLRISGPGLELDSDLQAPGEPIDVIVPGTGIFQVRCGIHPRMSMTITVR